MTRIYQEGGPAGVTSAGKEPRKNREGSGLVAGGRFDGRAGDQPESGHVIVEMALILPFFLLVVAGIIDLGALYWEKQVLTNASKEGARVAARAGAGGTADRRSSEIRQLVQDYLDRFHLKAPDGSNIVLIQGANFNYQWNTGVTPPLLWVEISNIPVQQYPGPLRRRFRDGSANPAGPDHHGGRMDHAAAAVTGEFSAFGRRRST
jgi:hypothetical protein